METVKINGRVFPISRIFSRNRNAWARLKDGQIVISIPSRWPSGEKEKIASNLLKRAVRSIERGRWNLNEGKRFEFSHGQRLIAMGKEFEISFIPSKRFGSRIVGRKLEVKVVEGHPEKHELASKLARKRIIGEMMPAVLARLHDINRNHFGADISKVTIRDNSSRWGSCTRDGSISLNFRLLFMPQEILDYVIVHELAHTKYLSHGKMFWALVQSVIPDHKERRRWLRENGWKAPKDGNAGQQTLGDIVFEEPY